MILKCYKDSFYRLKVEMEYIRIQINLEEEWEETEVEVPKFFNEQFILDSLEKRNNTCLSTCKKRLEMVTEQLRYCLKQMNYAKNSLAKWNFFPNETITESLALLIQQNESIVYYESQEDRKIGNFLQQLRFHQLRYTIGTIHERFYIDQIEKLQNSGRLKRFLKRGYF